MFAANLDTTKWIEREMTLLKREEWQDIVRDVDWTLSYVDYETVYPEMQSGAGKIPREAWDKWEESYKITFPEYVAVQREKEASTYGVKAALQRSSIWENLSEGWKSSTKLHFGGIALVEWTDGVLGELRMARFGMNAGWRNMAVFGALDEIRHNQVTLFFGHEFVGKDPQYDWTQKALHTNDWVSRAVRNMMDPMCLSSNVADTAVQLTYTFETGFTNMQFVALAADALESGDVNFANMISSIQTDEARHAQQGGPTLEIMMEHDPERAQWVVDKMFWLSAKAFSALTGIAMDYYTPVEHRKQSYREFMEEWIVDQFIQSITDYGLKRPWYWDEFMEGLDIWQHSMHLGVWFWRPTVWFKPAAGVDPDSREWLREKYPMWDEVYGDKWALFADNVNRGREDLTLPQTLPWLCNMCQLPTNHFTYGRDNKWRVRNHQIKHNGTTYHFCSKTCRQIWWADRDKMNHKTIVEKFVEGSIQPATVPGILEYMGITPDIAGTDSEQMAWTKSFYRTESGLSVPAAAGGVAE